jgi:hypothetical protein
MWAAFFMDRLRNEKTHDRDEIVLAPAGKSAKHASPKGDNLSFTFHTEPHGQSASFQPFPLNLTKVQSIARW